jgi:hypothetical protein
MTETLIDTREANLRDPRFIAWYASHEGAGLGVLKDRLLSGDADYMLSAVEYPTLDRRFSEYLAWARESADIEDGAHTRNLSIAPEVIASYVPDITPEDIEQFTGMTDTKQAKLRAIIEQRNAARANLALEQSEAARLRDVVRTLNYAATDPIDADDARLIETVWLPAAREATRRDYCEVYDQIASSVGGPTRAQLVDKGYSMRTTWNVEVYSFTVQVEAASIDAISQRDVDDAAARYIRDQLDSDGWEASDADGDDD